MNTPTRAKLIAALQSRDVRRQNAGRAVEKRISGQIIQTPLETMPFTNSEHNYDAQLVPDGTEGVVEESGMMGRTINSANMRKLNESMQQLDPATGQLIFNAGPTLPPPHGARA